MADPIDVAIAYFDNLVGDPSRAKPGTEEWFLCEGAAHAGTMLRSAKVQGFQVSPKLMKGLRQKMKVESALPDEL